MNPAYSVIFFTTASGAGYGALVWIVLLSGTGQLHAGPVLGAVLFLAALGLVTAGLLASTFHLGHPDRAWRGLSQWRSSWLSREAVAAIATYPPAVVFGAAWVFAGSNGAGWLWAGAAAGALAIVTVACTGMIYASLRAIPRWQDPLVVPIYLAFAVASGGILVFAIAALAGIAPGPWSWVVAIAVATAWLLKLAYWRRIDGAKPVATAESATGLGHIGTVRLLESPNSSPNYIMREMGYVIARKHAARLRRIALVVGGLMPFAAMVASGFGGAALSAVFLIVALVATGIGVLVERWLFFAEAEHASMLYYGKSTV